MNDLLRALLNLPPAASTFASGVDLLHYFVIGTTMLGATFVFLLALLYFIRSARQKPGAPTPRAQGSAATELTLIGALLTIFIVFWIVGATQYDRMMTAPPDAMPVYVTAKQWMWKFSYADGRSSMDVLTVPVNRPIKLVMTSRDVIHSFYVPAFRMKHDVVPGRYYAAWFQATTPGTFDIRCAEYCGVSHSRMLGSVRVLSAEDYGRWLETTTPGESQDLAASGLTVAARRGCLSCHTIDGQRHIGPTWAGLYGSSVKLEDGRTVVADDAYLTRSMMEPAGDVVAGFKPVMPVYRGVLEEPEVAALVELIASIRDRPVAPSVELPAVTPVVKPAPLTPTKREAP
ncbi:MAG TPA: cytochrome c oxidase subunit II [Polyangiaceae bacterium]|jgi:cytochrome c oxidase subunit II|nr:cytochrome c oxidase subunit II [Polyangiaceae bacterium]